jgi:two-component system cell cycle sensor histidine kinase/response regulator CckA
MFLPFVAFRLNVTFMPMAIKVLIADDEAIICENLAHILTSHGYAIVGCAGSGRVAIDLARKTPPDLIIMDVKLDGDLNGVEAAIVIQGELDRPIPVVFLRGFNLKEFPYLNVVHQGAYLNKPYTKKELIDCIEKALKNTSSFA